MLTELFFWSVTVGYGHCGITWNKKGRRLYNNCLTWPKLIRTAHKCFCFVSPLLTDSPPGLSCLPSVCSSIAMGIPTFLERPATTTFLPKVCMPMRKDRFSQHKHSQPHWININWHQYKIQQDGCSLCSISCCHCNARLLWRCSKYLLETPLDFNNLTTYLHIHGSMMLVKWHAGR